MGKENTILPFTRWREKVKDSDYINHIFRFELPYIFTTKIEEIIQHIITDIFMETGEMINLNAKERKQICNIVKKSYGIGSIEMIENCIENNNCELFIPVSDKS